MNPRMFRRTFPVGLRRCTLTYDATFQRLEAEWDPGKPGKDFLTDPVRMQQYRDGRDALLAEAADALGGDILVVET